MSQRLRAGMASGAAKEARSWKRSQQYKIHLVQSRLETKETWEDGNNECGMRRHEFNKKQTHNSNLSIYMYWLLINRLDLLGTLSIRIKYDRFYSIKMSTGTGYFHKQIISLRVLHDFTLWVITHKMPRPKDATSGCREVVIEMTKPSKNGPKSGRELRRRSRKEQLLPCGSWRFMLFSQPGCYVYAAILSYSCCWSFWKDPGIKSKNSKQIL